MAPSRQIARPHCLGRKRGIAEIDRPPSGAKDDARDLQPTSPLVRGHPVQDARNPVLRGVTFFIETVPGSNPPVVVPAADIALWDLSLGETADVDRPLHARAPLRCRASRHATSHEGGHNVTFKSRFTSYSA